MSVKVIKPASVWRRLAAFVALALTVTAGLYIFNNRSVFATPLPVVNKSGTLAANETWTAGNVYMVQYGLTVPSGITLTIDPGAIVKFTSSGYMVINQGGTLVAQGSSSDRIVFTSARDDSYGGDSNGDGLSNGSVANYDNAITSYGGSISMSYSDILHSSSTLIVSCYGNTTPNSVSVADSNFTDHMSVSSCPSSIASFKRNQFASEQSYLAAVSVESGSPAGIELSGPDANTFAGNDYSRQLYLYNATIGSGESWTIDNSTNAIPYIHQLYVEGGLTLNAGVVAKITNRNYYAIEVESGGEIHSQGSLLSPVQLTSYRDDTLGGDTDGSGSSTAVADDYTGGILAHAGSHVDVVHTTFKYGTGSIAVGCSSAATTATSIEDSTLYGTVEADYCKSTEFSMQRNQLAAAHGYGVKLNGTEPMGVVLAGANQNTGAGGVGSSVYVSSPSKLPSGSTWTVSGTSGVVLVNADLEVDGTLNLEAGAVVKSARIATYASMEVVGSGELNVSGTSADPVIFTSLQDDSVGGDTNDNGVSTRTGHDYTTAVSFTNGTSLNISHAIIRGGGTALEGGCGSSANLTVQDNEFNSSIAITSCKAGNVSFKHNKFAVDEGYALTTRDTNMTYFDMSGSDSNYASGGGQGIALLAATGSVVPASASWDVSGNGGMVLADGGLSVDGTMTITDGQVVKSQGSAPLNVESGGSLVVSGSATSPVIFTSLADDTQKGDTNANGPSSGSVNDYGSAISTSASSSSLSVSHAVFSYAASALYLTDGVSKIEDTEINHSTYGLEVLYAVAAFRGEFNNIAGKAIKACNWSETGCSVDASYVDWGSADGPFDTNPSNNQVCGAVSVGPWEYGSTDYSADNLYNVKNCDGSSTPDSALTSATSSFSSRVAAKQIDCSGGYQAACDAINNAMACLTGAIDVASSAYPVPIPTVSSTGDVSSFAATMKGYGAGYVEDKATQTLTGIPSRNGIGASTVVSVFGALIGAYNSCAP